MINYTVYILYTEYFYSNSFFKKIQLKTIYYLYYKPNTKHVRTRVSI